MEFSSFVETTWEWNSILSLKVGKKITKVFPVKKIPCKFFVKETQIKIKGNSFVKFTVGGPQSIYKGISLLIDRRPPAENFTKEFPLILIWVHFTKDSHGKFFLQGNPL